MKRYCKNCQYYRFYNPLFGLPEDQCQHVFNFEKNAVGRDIRKFNPSQINQNLDCVQYQRVWWKFWVKNDT